MISDDSVLIIVMSSLAVFYFVSAYFAIDVKEIYGVIVLKVTGIASAVCITGIQFQLMRSPGALEMLMIGFTSVSIAALILVILFMRSQDRVYLPYLIRSLVLGGITGWLYLISQSPVE